MLSIMVLVFLLRHGRCSSLPVQSFHSCRDYAFAVILLDRGVAVAGVCRCQRYLQLFPDFILSRIFPNLVFFST